MMQQILLIYDVVDLKIAFVSLADKTDSTQEHFAGKWPQDLRGLTYKKWIKYVASIPHTSKQLYYFNFVWWTITLKY